MKEGKRENEMKIKGNKKPHFQPIISVVTCFIVERGVCIGNSISSGRV